MADENKVSNEVPSDNIFKELSWGLDFWHTEEVKEWVVKDKIYYMRLYGNIFSIVNIGIFIIFTLLFLFVKIQNNPENYSKNFLDPFCFVILSDEMQNTGDYCSSVSSLVVDYDAKIIALKKDIVDKLSLIVKDLYIYESFIDSKEIAFLLDKKTNRLNPLDIMNDFDKMKLDFSWMDKKRIVCQWLEILSDATLNVSCDVYSSSWEEAAGWNGIIDTTWNIKSSQMEGSSLSIAASFLNFIEKNPQYNFQIIDKQKTFSSASIIWEWPYVKSTKLNIKLKYNNLKNNLSL